MDFAVKHQNVGSSTTPQNLLALVTGAVFALPTYTFFVTFNINVVAAAVAMFIVPLLLLLQRARFNPEQLKTMFLVLGLLLGPLLVSILVHLADYDVATLIAIAPRLIAITLFVLIAALLSMQPDARPLIERCFAVLGLAMAALFVSAAVLFPEWSWGGRLVPRGMQPNWWGEVLFVAAFGSCFIRLRLLRYGLLALVAGGLVLVQSRSGMMGAAPLLVASVLLREGLRRLLILGVVGLFVALPLFLAVDGMLLDARLGRAIVGFFTSDVLLLDHAYRGLDSGATGRAEGWQAALGAIGEQPFFGYGFGRTHDIVIDRVGKLLHSGHLMLLGDVGVPFYALLMAAVLAAIVRATRRGELAFAAVLFGYILLITVQPRVINSNVMSMVAWMAFALIWLLPPSVATASTTPPLQPLSRPIGARWRRA